MYSLAHHIKIDQTVIIILFLSWRECLSIE
uniref:Uncharacterized protein n=1 Tax=Lepeophtheirus salmonis TaxID=72036 RepID=A0A0K2U0P8_LEPSM